jgi:hypothetical protein
MIAERMKIIRGGGEKTERQAYGVKLGGEESQGPGDQTEPDEDRRICEGHPK